MLNPFICGNFHNQEEEDCDNQISPCSTPTRKSRTKKDTKNPYSTRGLDKFSALLAELEEKRQHIYSQVGSQDISFVRFVYSNSNDCVPVIVKIKDPQRPSVDHPNRESNQNITPPDHQSVNKVIVNEEKKSESENKKKKNKKKVYFKLHKWRRPSYYMPLFVIFILLFLAIFGRSVAILCTSIGWYLVPTIISKTSSKSASNSNKKQLVRRFSEVGTKSNNNIVGSDGKNLKSPHGRQNSF